MPFDGASLNPTAAHLLRAKQYLMIKGWSPDAPVGAGHSVCMAVAIGRTSTSESHRAGYLLGETIGVEPSYIDGHSIGVWQRGKTFEQVLGAFDQAIAAALNETV